MSKVSKEPLHSYLLAHDFQPSNKDIICGRARENFHHDGNRYFRDLIQQNVAPYLAARTKLEKSEAIAMIVDKVNQNSPHGGFIKKDPISRRWYKIKDCDARDKVGHAIRKAVQRLEETKPKLAARMKKEYISQMTKTRSTIKGFGRENLTVLDKEEAGNQSTTVQGNVRKSIAQHSSISVDPNKTDLKAIPKSFETIYGNTASRVGASLPTASLSFPTSLIRGLPPGSSPVPGIDSAALLAASLMAQSQQFKPPLPAHIGSLFLLNNGAPSPVSAEKMLLEEALRQRREAQLSSELSYARQLALSSRQSMPGKQRDTDKYEAVKSKRKNSKETDE